MGGDEGRQEEGGGTRREGKGGGSKGLERDGMGVRGSEK